MIFQILNDNYVFIENKQDVAIKYMKEFHIYRNMVLLLFQTV